MDEIKKGIYKHFKGGEYEVLGVAKHSESQKELVIYCNRKNGSLWARPIEMFLDEVSKPEHDFKGQRFTFMREF